MASPNGPMPRDEEIDRGRVVLLFVAQYVFFALLLFVAAGDAGWRRGWLFLLVSLATSAVLVPFIWRVNPGLVVARTSHALDQTVGHDPLVNHDRTAHGNLRGGGAR